VPKTHAQPISYTSAFQLFSLSKAAVKRNITTFVVLVIVPSLLFLISNVIDFPGRDNLFSSTQVEPSPAGLTFIILGVVLSILFTPAAAVAAVAASQGKEITYQEALKQSWPIFFKFYSLSILIALAVLIGLILLIVPGIIVLQRLFLAPYFLIDQKMDVIEALKQSSNQSKGKFAAIFGIIGVSLLLSLPAIIPLAGTFVAVVLGTLYYCAPAMRYFEIIKNKKLKPSADAA